jgi:outer membrane lipoprotein-sorting protein
MISASGRSKAEQASPAAAGLLSVRNLEGCATVNANQHPMRTLFLIIFVLASVTGVAQSEPLSAPAVKELLARIREKRAAAPHVEADFQEEKTIHLMNKPIVSAGKAWFEAPSKFRREVKGNSPSITVSNGSQLWIYYPNFKSAERYSLGKRSPLDAGIAALTAALNLENVEGNYRITATKTDKGYEMELLPRHPSMKRLFQKFNLRLNDDLQVEHTEMLQPNGDRIVTVYSNQKRAPIPSSTFEFTPPAGTDVTAPLGR